MLDGTIQTFLLVARLGSFSRAAKELYLSPNAVKKRVRALECQTGLTLFERSNRGLTITPAGSSLMEDLRVISRQLDRAVTDARAIQERRTETVWLGVSATFAEELLSSRWPGVDHIAGRSSARVVHYGPSARDREEMLLDVGARTDLCIDLFEPQAAAANGLRAWEISRFRLCLAMPESAKAHETELGLADIGSGTIALLPPGRSSAVDSVRERLARERADVALVDLADYDVRTLNELWGRGCGFVAPENVSALCPYLSFAPIADAPLASFGIYGPARLSDAAQEFVQELVKTRNF